MNNHTIGFIGYGNMAQAIAQGMVDAGVLDGEHIVAAPPTTTNSNATPPNSASEPYTPPRK